MRASRETSPAIDLPPGLSPEVARVLGGLVAAAGAALGDDLRAIVLFGSAAEGRMRATSDVNVILVLRRFAADAIDGLRDIFRAAHAAARVEPMFLLEDEVGPAVEAFAVKFADVLRRRHVVHGRDPFAGITLSRTQELARLRQVLLNFALRLRERYVRSSLRDEQAARLVAESAGPLRSFASALLELEGRPPGTPKEALAAVVAGLPETSFAELLPLLSEAREERGLPPGAAAGTLLRLVDLALAMRARADRLVTA
jgi:predicted nucleotidyltransferase